ncbi:MAG: HAMP domain-containing protein [Aquamicrobium sp.]|uniref:ATP-binding protein n=1 Tax=Mesorhizobium sp. Pch-S TaxID=2082387 RepID=UPI0010116A76|nr:ATP-binding protein [Mesorhizobium sp. Pch-S]MBR2691954.1 HAMP domain-containing protein [Aquamicrobium sp.]QAZ42916.1 two-component sensor histidine kinase [Mesorhizobium sp. Pch-S]
MNWFWGKSLAAQIIWLMLPILLVAQIVGFVVTADERATELREMAQDEFVVRTTTAILAIETMPGAYQDALVGVMDTNYSRFWLSQEGPGDLDAWSRDAWRRLQQPLSQNGSQGSGPLDVPGAKGVDWGETDSTALKSVNSVANARWEPIELKTGAKTTQAQIASLEGHCGAGLAAQMPDGRWLNAACYKPPKTFLWKAPTIVTLAITTIVLSGLAVVVARRIARPMKQLTSAAESLGRCELGGHIPEEGPDDIRRTAVAFNQMQQRLSRFLADRTAMLAAIGHDLRTPITTMRLRSEFVADAETKSRLLETVDEMQAITEATLELTQEQSIDEPSRPVDVAALVESICEDLADLGRDVLYKENGVVPYRCRPDSLRRATRNLIENALRYGKQARVSIMSSEAGVNIQIDDSGPGIPESEIERVFLPFVRLEESRNANTGGIGLGLAIARNIARAHGGDVLLNNRPEGLRAILHLPPIPGELTQHAVAETA